MKHALLIYCLFLIASHAQAVLSVGINLLQPSYCGRPSGSGNGYGQGGTPPYTYSWSTGGTESMLTGLFAGTYTLTVTDAVLDQATADLVVPLQSSYNFYSGYSGLPVGYCSGDPFPLAFYTGQNDIFQTYDPTGLHGPWPYSFSHPNLVDFGQISTCQGVGPVYNLLHFNGAPGSIYNVDLWDADGCPGTIEVYVEQPFTAPAIQIVGIGPSCQNSASGTMTVALSGTYGKEFGIHVRRANQTLTCPATEVQGWTFDSFSQNDGLRSFNGLQPGDHYLVWTTDPLGFYTSNFNWNYECKDSVLFTVPEILADCGSLSGRLYLDDDADCTMDGGENRVPNSIVTVEPGPYYLTTNDNGQYTTALPYGSYTVNEQHPSFVQSCPAPFTLSGPGVLTVNTACAGGQPLDVMVDVGSGPARPGFALGYGLHVRNLTPASTGTVTLTLEVDPALTYISSTPPASSVVGNIITWTDPQLTLSVPFQERHVHVSFQVPPDVGLIGTDLNATATIATQNTDGDLSNNTYAHSVTVTGSFDPNDKVAATSSGLSDSQFFLQQDEWIDYTIRFQNTGTDTAFNIVVSDTIPPQLDPGSILMGAASHPYTWNLTLDGILSIVFADIMLPDSNVNEAASHGFVLLRIKPQGGLMPGEIISNIANIFFDFNPAVITEPSVLVAEFSTGALEQAQGQGRLHLLPNPVNDRLSIASDEVIESIRIFATDGREVIANVRASASSLDVSSLDSGSYLLIATMDDGSIFRERFIKH